MRGIVRKVVGGLAAVGLVLGLPSAAVGDQVTNTLDGTIDATVEVLNLTEGGTASTVTLSLTASENSADGNFSDTQNGCNLGGNANDATLWQGGVTTAGAPARLKLTASSGNTDVATVTSPSAFTACSPDAGYQQTISVTPVGDGTTTITFAIDVANSKWRTNSTTRLTSASFTVNVAPLADSTPPTLSNVPSNMTVEATSASGAPASWTAPTATDAVDTTPTVTCAGPGGLVSGSTFPLGATTVSCTAADDAGNTSAAQTFTVTVVDTNAPTLSNVPSNMVVSATSASGAPASWTAPTATDAVDATPTVTCAGPGGLVSGSTFPLGATTVSCTAADDAGNTSAAQTFTVTVADTTPPTLSNVPSDMTVEGTSAAGAEAHWLAPTGTDAVDATPTVTCAGPGGLVSGSTFPLGATTVSCTAADDAGNTSAAQTFTVTVVDTTAPVLADMPTNMTVEATSASGAPASWTAPTATDAVDATPTVSCGSAGGLVSGDTFPLGSTTVSCTAADDAGNTSAAQTFTVGVVDTTPPALQLPANITRTATGGSAATVEYLATATDIVDGNVVITCLPSSGSSFSAGTTTVNCSATDVAGNNATGSFTVTVSYSWTGFFQPVDKLPTKNTVKAGRAIPVKFSLGGDQGMNVIAGGWPKEYTTPCTAAAGDAVETTTTAGSSSLSYDTTTGTYNYVWKTESTWAGSCRLFQLKLIDGTVHEFLIQVMR